MPRTTLSKKGRRHSVLHTFPAQVGVVGPLSSTHGEPIDTWIPLSGACIILECCYIRVGCFSSVSPCSPIADFSRCMLRRPWSPKESTPGIAHALLDPQEDWHQLVEPCLGSPQRGYVKIAKLTRRCRWARQDGLQNEDLSVTPLSTTATHADDSPGASRLSLLPRYGPREPEHTRRPQLNCATTDNRTARSTRAPDVLELHSPFRSTPCFIVANTRPPLFLLSTLLSRSAFDRAFGLFLFVTPRVSASTAPTTAGHQQAVSISRPRITRTDSASRTSEKHQKNRAINCGFQAQAPAAD